MFSSESLKPVEVHFPPWGSFVLESHHAKQFRMPDTAHAFYKIMYVLKGYGAVQSVKMNVRIAPGDVIAVAPGFRHRIVDDARAPLALIVLCIQKQVAAFPQDDEALKCFPAVRCYRQDALAEEARHILRQMLFEQTLQRPATAGMITGLALQLMSAVLRLQSNSASPARREKGLTGNSSARVRAYVRDLEQQFWKNEKIDNVAARLGISRRQFTKLFRAVTGASWLEYVRGVRIRHACSLLAADRSITTAAFECGFDDLSSFYRTFKARMGCTPQQYREKKSKPRQPTV